MARTARVKKTAKIKKNDQVYILTGRDRGKTGRVMKVYRSEDRVLVEGVNMVKKAVKANPGKNVKGGIVEREQALHLSNVAIVCPETNAPSRVGRKILEDGSRIRVATKSGAALDKA